MSNGHSGFLPAHEGIEARKSIGALGSGAVLKNRNVHQMTINKMVYVATVKAEVPLNHDVGVYSLSGYPPGD